MNTQTKHTPGPWKADGIDWINTPDAGGFRVQLISGENFTVSQVMADEDDDEQTANARLIAAAPDMLEALQNIKSNLTGKDCPAERWASSLRYATEAIAKAEAV